MVESRHRTVLEIGVDDREVRGLGATMDRTFSTKTIDAFERSLDRTSRTLGKLIEQQVRLTQVLDRMDQRQRQSAAAGRAGGGPQQGPGGPGTGGGGGQAGFFRSAGATAVGSYLGNVLARGASGSGAVATALGAMPAPFGPVLAGGVTGVQGFYQSHIGRVMARAGAFGATGIGQGGFGSLERAGARMGLGTGQSAGMAAQMAGQTGMVGPELLQAMLGGLSGGGQRGAGLMGLAQSMGFQNLGGVLGAAGAAGGQGQFDMGGVVRDSISSGVVAGFREGRLDRFFAQFGSWLEGMRTNGIQINTGSALQLIRGTALLGQSFTGEAGSRAGMGFQQAITGAGQRTGAASLMMLRASGLRGGGFGNRGYMEARAFAEKKPATVMQNFMQMFRRVAGDATPGQAALFAEQAMRSLGMNMTANQAMEFAQSAMRGGEGFTFGMTQEEASEQARGPVQRMAARRAVAAGADRRPGVLTEAGRETQYELGRANLGARLAGPARAIRNLEFALANQFLPAVGSLTSYINRATVLIRNEDWVGLAALSVSPLVAAGEALGETLFENVGASSVRQSRRGIQASDEGQSRVLREMEERGIPAHLRQGALERMEAGTTTPEAERSAMDDGISMIINGANQIVQGAERLQNERLPGESDLTSAPV